MVQNCELMKVDGVNEHTFILFARKVEGSIIDEVSF
jgi:hypothetical protein